MKKIMVDPPKRVTRTHQIVVARVDPATRTAVVMKIAADMKAIRRVVGAQHVGTQHIWTGENVGLHVCCCNSVAEGPLWRISGAAPVRGRGILYNNLGMGPADFPFDNAWLCENIEFEPAGARAINDPVPPIAASADGGCELCASECRGHRLGRPEDWQPEPGSRAYAERERGQTAE